MYAYVCVSTFSNFSSETARPIEAKFMWSFHGMGERKFVQMVQVTLRIWPPCPDDTGFTLTYFTARSNSVPNDFVQEKGKTMDFSETIVVYDIKVGRCSQLNEYMNLYEYQRSRHSLTLVQGHSDSTFSNIFSLETARPTEVKLHVEPNESEYKLFMSHDQDGHHAHIWEKPLKIFLPKG